MEWTSVKVGETREMRDIRGDGTMRDKTYGRGTRCVESVRDKTYQRNGHAESIRDKDYERDPRYEDDKTQYNTLDGKVYEDPDYIYGAYDPSAGAESKRRMVVSPPSRPPPMNPTHIAFHNNKQKRVPRWRSVLIGSAIALLVIALLIAVIVLLVIGDRAQSLFHKSTDVINTNTIENDVSASLTPPTPIRDAELTSNHLLTLLITKRKVCLFEAGNGDDAASQEAYLKDHLDTARLLFHSNLSHSGVPVHPLQFQRYARSLGVDVDCHVVIYDRGQVIWAAYAAWVFKLFGHRHVSLLGGGYLGWKTQQARSPQYLTSSGFAPKSRPGNFLSSWNDSLIVTFDDVFTNSEMKEFTLVDAQTEEEYHGVASGALYGHIKDAVNIPVDSIYDWTTGQWKKVDQLAKVFVRAGLRTQKPVIVYCSTSLRSSMVWWALNKLGYSARIYFGGWPEWVVRAPDDLKVLG